MDSAELGKVVECTATTPLAEATLIEGEIPDPFGLEFDKTNEAAVQRNRSIRS